MTAPAASTAAAKPRGAKGDDLYKAILSLRTVPEARRFFRDLLTDDELSMLSRRWQVVSMLSEGLHYREIEERTGMSSRTVARIARWFKQGPGGYQIALARHGRKKKKAADR
jgi:TrpR-related protein YerC/YecD